MLAIHLGLFILGWFTIVTMLLHTAALLVQSTPLLSDTEPLSSSRRTSPMVIASGDFGSDELAVGLPAEVLRLEPLGT